MRDKGQERADSLTPSCHWPSGSFRVIVFTCQDQQSMLFIKSSHAVSDKACNLCNLYLIVTFNVSKFSISILACQTKTPVIL